MNPAPSADIIERTARAIVRAITLKDGYPEAFASAQANIHWQHYTAAAQAAHVEAFRMLPIDTAPRNGTPVLAQFKIDAFSEEDRWSAWNGKFAVVRHHGIDKSIDLDLGWSINGPCGQGGYYDHLFAGWLPLPTPARPPEAS